MLLGFSCFSVDWVIFVYKSRIACLVHFPSWKRNWFSCSILFFFIKSHSLLCITFPIALLIIRKMDISLLLEHIVLDLFSQIARICPVLSFLGNTPWCIEQLSMTRMCIFWFSAAILIKLGEISKTSLDFFELRLFSIFQTSPGSLSFKNKLSSMGLIEVILKLVVSLRRSWATFVK